MVDVTVTYCASRSLMVDVISLDFCSSLATMSVLCCNVVSRSCENVKKKHNVVTTSDVQQL